MFHHLLREVSLRGALARLGAFTYLALGVSWLLVHLFWPHHTHHIVRHATYCSLGIACPLIALFAKSVTFRWIAILLLAFAFAGWTLLPELQ
jgi:hypothetical protein